RFRPQNELGRGSPVPSSAGAEFNRKTADSPKTPGAQDGPNRIRPKTPKLFYFRVAVRIMFYQEGVCGQPIQPRVAPAKFGAGVVQTAEACRSGLVICVSRLRTSMCIRR